ncbi:MAG: PfkB family carbohydrate kinase [Candidatus Hodarchaeota archaeon]
MINYCAIVIGKLAYKLCFSISGKLSDFSTDIEETRIIESSDINRQYGGMAGNIAYGLSILGVSPIIISQVGRDFDWYYRPHLEKLGIKIKVFTDPERETACWYEIQDELEEKLVIEQDNSYRFFAEKKIDEILEENDFKLINAAFVGTGKVEADIKFISDLLKQNIKIPIIYSPDSNAQELTKWRLSNIFNQITVMICTEDELKNIEHRMKISRDEILSNSKRIKYIISLYERSKIIINSKETKIKVSEGPAEEILSNDLWQDAFRAGIVYGVSLKKPIEEAAGIGSALASYAVETRECQKYSPSFEQVSLRSFEVKIIKKEY